MHGTLGLSSFALHLRSTVEDLIGLPGFRAAVRAPPRPSLEIARRSRGAVPAGLVSLTDGKLSLLCGASYSYGR